MQALGDWLKEFMEEAAAKDLRVDFITMHSYPSPNSDSFLENVQKLYDRYGKPIWITEYAVADWDATAKSPSRFGKGHHGVHDRDGRRATTDAVRRTFRLEDPGRGRPHYGRLSPVPEDGSLTPTGELYRSL